MNEYHHTLFLAFWRKSNKLITAKDTTAIHPLPTPYTRVTNKNQCILQNIIINPPTDHS